MSAKIETGIKYVRECAERLGVPNGHVVLAIQDDDDAKWSVECLEEAEFLSWLKESVPNSDDHGRLIVAMDGMREDIAIGSGRSGFLSFVVPNEGGCAFVSLGVYELSSPGGQA